MAYVVYVRHPLAPENERLVEALGYEVVVRPDAPRCDRIVCRRCDAVTTIAAHQMTEVVNCEIPGCDQEAGSGGRLCDNHARRNGVEKKPCRVPGCDGDASGAPARGAYASKCEAHRQAESDRRRAASGIGGGGSARPAAPAAGGRESFQAKASRLVAAGKTLDQAISGRAKTTARLRAKKAQIAQIERVAEQDVAAALTEWRRVCRELAGDDPATDPR